MSVDDEKAYLRRRLKQARISLTETERHVSELRICQSVECMGLSSLSGSDSPADIVICMYAATQGEVDISRVFPLFRANGLRIAFPLVTREGHMDMVEVHSLDDLSPGRYGILEPSRDAPRIWPQDVTMIFVPGVAFTASGFRLGYGGGYYDRYLKRVRPTATTVGVGFRFQVQGELPVGAYDVPLRYVITEQGVLDCKTEI
ncbi:5-formyltetrahydrofolate cyclo-ligase [Alicyclobacillus dauci]|uniref:5-formyltetrahydrofolate cyclo-ligase n=1 Tax=Alicyclobacillus dauci TaxID=1475485 RepID=A0ABY6Z1A7_9BACL|nr:5-formyltetrahydrofolate cyclo-ligase [Alicyclobacillus dauci]WAH36664.1 5-formyltetrahydrofolate cyclo-ligase [Alicyclobacillus dauci]